MPLEERVEFGTARQDISADEDFIENMDGRGLIRYDLACGQKKKEGYLGIDKEKLDGIDIVHDLMQFPWPIDDESVYEFHCAHFVEHIPILLQDGSYGLARFMEEVYRCLMPSGMITIVAPYYMSQEAWQDFTHCRAITPRTFAYFDKETTKKFGLDHYTGNADFVHLSITRLIGPEWEAKSEEAKKWAMEHYWNVTKEISFILRKR
jgi:hypothetical protein